MGCARGATKCSCIISLKFLAKALLNLFKIGAYMKKLTLRNSL